MTSYLGLFKELKVSEIIHSLHERIVEKQHHECKPEALAYLADRKQNGRPFPKDYSNEPNTIIRMKHFMNGLYLIEQVFKKLEDAPDKLYSTILSIPGIQNEAYEGIQLLTQAGSDIASAYTNEYKQLGAYLAWIKTLVAPNTDEVADLHTEQQQKARLMASHQAGVITGHLVDQLKPKQGRVDYDLISYGVTTLPNLIETARVKLENFTMTASKHAPNIKREKIEELVHKSKKLAKTLRKSHKGFLSFLQNIAPMLDQLSSLIGEIKEQAGFLDNAIQDLIREYLAQLKYDILPFVFAEIDKIEYLLMLKPGRLSKPIMSAIKPLYEAAIQNLRGVVDFDSQGEALLKLEDARFIELRLRPMHAQRTKTQVSLLHIDDAIDTVSAIKRRFDQTYLEELTTEKMQTTIRLIQPYLSLLNETTQQTIAKQFQLSTLQNLTSLFLGGPTVDDQTQISEALTQLIRSLEQIKTDQTFRLKTQKDLIDCARASSTMTVFPHSPILPSVMPTERETLQSRHHKLDHTIAWSSDGRVNDPSKLSMDAIVDLTQFHQDQLDELTRVEQANQALIDALKRPNVAADLSFKYNYQIHLPVKEQYHQANKLYTTIKDGVLYYECLEPQEETEVYLMTLENAEKRQLKGCYVWDNEKKHLNYIAEDGRIDKNIKLQNSTFLEAYFLLTKKKYKGESIRPLNSKQINGLITSQTFHRHAPGIIHKGSIPLSELNCPLKTLNNPSELTPYRKKIFAEARERGHIKHPLQSELIQHYGVIQPYFMQLMKPRATEVDRKMCYTLSGRFTSQPMPDETASKIKSVLTSFGRQITEQKEITAAQLTRYRNERQNNDRPPSHHHLSSSMPSFSDDAAEWFASLETLNLAILHSRKQMHFVKLAKNGLEHYLKKRDLHDLSDLGIKDILSYENFLSNLLKIQDLKELSKADINRQLDNLIQETSLDLRRHQRLLSAIQHKRSKLPAATMNVARYPTSNIQAFLTLKPEMTLHVMPMKKGETPAPGYIYLKIQDETLHYECYHYNKTLRGSLPLDSIHPPVIRPQKGETLHVTAETLHAIRVKIYKKRSQQITLHPAELSVLEALDLSLWFSTKAEEQSRLKIELLNQIKLYSKATSKQAKETYKNAAQYFYTLLQPDLMHAYRHPQDQKLCSCLSDFEKMFAAFQNKPGELARHIDHSIDQLDHEHQRYLTEANRRPEHPYIRQTSRKHVIKSDPSRSHYLIKHEYTSQALAELKTLILDYQTCLNPSMRAALKPQRTGVPYPNIETVKGKMEEAHQTLGIKRLVNIVYHLEEFIHQLEQVHDQQLKTTYITHIVYAYLELQQAIWLSQEFITDPTFNAIYQTILNKATSIYNTLEKEAHVYIDKKETTNDDGDEQTQHILSSHTHHELPTEAIPGLKSLINALYIIPERLSSKLDANFKNKAIVLKAEANKSIHRINKIINRYFTAKMSATNLISTVSLQRLAKELPERINALFHKTHDQIIQSLREIKTDLLGNVLIEVDEIENRLGLTLGSLSTPLKEILDEFYQGLITPLIDDMDEKLSLLNDTKTIEKRQAAAKQRSGEHATNLTQTAYRIRTLKALIEEIDQQNSFQFWRSTRTIETLNQAYLDAVPSIKSALNGQDLHFLSMKTLSETHRMQLRHCLVWDTTPYIKQYGVYYIDDHGHPHKIELKNYKPLKQWISANRGSNEKLYLSAQMLKTLIQEQSKETILLPTNNSYFQIQYTEHDLSNLNRGLADKPSTQDRETFKIRMTSMKPMLQECLDYYNGQRQTLKLAQRLSHEQSQFLEETHKLNQNMAQERREITYNQQYDQLANAIAETRPGLNGVHYDIGLQRGLAMHKSQLIKSETIHQLSLKAIETSIKTYKKDFDDKYLIAYRQLNRFDQVLNKLENYLNKMEQQIRKKSSTFENKATIQRKKALLTKLRNIVHKKSLNASQRIDELKQVIAYDPETLTSKLDPLLDYHALNYRQYKWIEQKILLLFKYLHLYTPEVQKHFSQLHQVIYPTSKNISMLNYKRLSIFSAKSTSTTSTDSPSDSSAEKSVPVPAPTPAGKRNGED